MREIDSAIVFNKLNFMERYLQNLKQFESLTLEEYLLDSQRQLAIERLLQLTIQVALDVNRYFFKCLDLPQPEKNFDTFIELSRLNIITPELAEVLAESGSLRNRLVHLYEEINPVLVHVAIEKALRYYPIYQRQVTTYLDSLEVNDG